MKLTSENVLAVLNACFYTDEEVKNGVVEEALVIEGITMKVGFHPERVDQYRDEIKSMLEELPDAFFKDGGGGGSFLALCETKKGEQWGEHRHMEALCCLAIAASIGQWCAPKKMWSVLPGGMPYIVFDKAA